VKNCFLVLHNSHMSGTKDADPRTRCASGGCARRLMALSPPSIELSIRSQCSQQDHFRGRNQEQTTWKGRRHQNVVVDDMLSHHGYHRSGICVPARVHECLQGLIRYMIYVYSIYIYIMLSIEYNAVVHHPTYYSCTRTNNETCPVPVLSYPRPVYWKWDPRPDLNLASDMVLSAAPIKLCLALPLRRWTTTMTMH
jgi:hypothetical protein